MNINATLFGQAITFAILVWFTYRFVWPPLLNAIDERTKKIADGLAAAERGKHDFELAEKRAADKIREGKQQAAQIIQQAEKRAAQVIDEAKQTAKEEGERLLVSARAQAEQEVHRAKEFLRQQVADLVVAGTEKILRREIDTKTHNDILTSIQAEL